MEPDPRPTIDVNPSRAGLAALAATPDDGAIIMVNLLRFRPDGGRDAYARYGAVASGTVAARGGSIAYTAPVIGADPEWDTVTLVRYPRRAAYLDMQTDPDYVGAIPDRTRGLSARLLYPFHSVGGDPDDPFRIERSGGDETFVVSLLRLADDFSFSEQTRLQPPGAMVLHLQAVVPLVSDGRWDELIVTRFPSPGDVPSDTWSHDRAVVASITLPTRPMG